MNKGDLDSAIAASTEAIALDPEQQATHSYHTRAVCHGRKGERT